MVAPLPLEVDVYRYVIEACKDGQLDFTVPQPESVFGMRAITGITEDQMAKTIYRLKPDVVLHGAAISGWPSLINPAWRARRKTW